MPLKITHFYEGGEVFKTFDNIKKIPAASIKVVLFLYDIRKPLIDTIETLKPSSFKNSDFKKIYEDAETQLLKFNIIKNNETKQPEHTEVYLLIFKNTPFAMLITNGDSKYFFYDIVPFFNKYYPFISRIFLRSEEILELLNNVEKEKGMEIVVKNYVLKRYYVKKKIETTWEIINYKDLFKKAKQDFLWVDGVYINLKKDDEVLGKVRISRKGIIRYSAMDYTEIYNLFIGALLSKYGIRYDTILKERARSINNIEPRPVKFTINEDVFKDQRDVDQLIELIHSSMQNWGYSILYREGAYLYLVMHDYISGSSFDIFVASISEIIIIPQTQVTSLAFNTLINFLMRTYDGMIENA